MHIGLAFLGVVAPILLGAELPVREDARWFDTPVPEFALADTSALH